jgi:predicted Zn-dependent peptidase
MKLLKRKLSNGIIVVMEKRELPVVSVCIANKFGAGFEKSEVKGIAHFIEHLVFTGTKTRTHEDISREIEKKGGILNAFTNHEITGYWFKLPSEHIFAGLDILIDMLKNPLFDKEKFEKEKKVILEELKMYHDDPRRYALQEIERNLYKKPFGETIGGSEKTVGAMERDFVFDFFKKNYSPENYTVVVVGDCNSANLSDSQALALGGKASGFDKVCEYIEKNFKAEGKKVSAIRIEKKNGESTEEREGLDQAHFVFAVHAPLASEKDFSALEVLDAYLGDGMSSKLFLEIREKRGLAYAVKSFIEGEKNYCYYGVYVGTTKDKVDEVKKIILEEFDKVKNINEKELKEAKERVIGLRKVSQEESVEVMEGLLYEELRGDAEEYYKHEEKINRVKLEDVKRLAKELIKQGFSTAAIVPK